MVGTIKYLRIRETAIRLAARLRIMKCTDRQEWFGNLAIFDTRDLRRKKLRTEYWTNTYLTTNTPWFVLAERNGSEKHIQKPAELERGLRMDRN